MLIIHDSNDSKGEPDTSVSAPLTPSVLYPDAHSSSNMFHPESGPFVGSAIRRLFPGDGSAEPEPDLTDGVPGVRKLKRRLRSESKANYRRRKEIEGLNERLRVMEDRDQRTKDDLAACRRENNRLMDQLRSGASA